MISLNDIPLDVFLKYFDKSTIKATYKPDYKPISAKICKYQFKDNYIYSYYDNENTDSSSLLVQALGIQSAFISSGYINAHFQLYKSAIFAMHNIQAFKYTPFKYAFKTNKLAKSITDENNSSYSDFQYNLPENSVIENNYGEEVLNLESTIISSNGYYYLNVVPEFLDNNKIIIYSTLNLNMTKLTKPNEAKTTTGFVNCTYKKLSDSDPRFYNSTYKNFYLEANDYYTTIDNFNQWEIFDSNGESIGILYENVEYTLPEIKVVNGKTYIKSIKMGGSGETDMGNFLPLDELPKTNFESFFNFMNKYKLDRNLISQDDKIEDFLKIYPDNSIIVVDYNKENTENDYLVYYKLGYDIQEQFTPLDETTVINNKDQIDYAIIQNGELYHDFVLIDLTELFTRVTYDEVNNETIETWRETNNETIKKYITDYLGKIESESDVTIYRDISNQDKFYEYKLCISNIGDIIVNTQLPQLNKPGKIRYNKNSKNKLFKICSTKYEYDNAISYFKNYLLNNILLSKINEATIKFKETYKTNNPTIDDIELEKATQKYMNTCKYYYVKPSIINKGEEITSDDTSLVSNGGFLLALHTICDRNNTRYNNTNHLDYNIIFKQHVYNLGILKLFSKITQELDPSYTNQGCYFTDLDGFEHYGFKSDKFKLYIEDNILLPDIDKLKNPDNLKPIDIDGLNIDYSLYDKSNVYERILDYNKYALNMSRIDSIKTDIINRESNLNITSRHVVSRGASKPSDLSFEKKKYDFSAHKERIIETYVELYKLSTNYNSITDKLIKDLNLLLSAYKKFYEPIIEDLNRSEEINGEEINTSIFNLEKSSDKRLNKEIKIIYTNDAEANKNTFKAVLELLNEDNILANESV